MTAIKMEVQNAKLGNQDPRRKAGSWLQASWGELCGTELKRPGGGWDQAYSQLCEPGKRGFGVQVGWTGAS